MNRSGAAIGVAGLPLVLLAVVVVIIAGAGAAASPASAACAGGGTGQTINSVQLDAEQVGNARTIVSVTAGRHLPVYAAVIAVTTAYTESRLYNSSVQTDHDSEGLFQQRVSIYTEVVAIDPVKATNAFLDRLVKIPGWQSTPVGIAAQTVQISAYPDRYQPNAALAQQLVGQFWPAAAAAAGPGLTVGGPGDVAPVGANMPAMGSGPAICAGGGGAGSIVGPTGNTVAGTTTIPAGFVISGTAKGSLAVKFALNQLGKPYVWAAAGPNAFDCSGLTMAAWAAAGVALPHFTGAQIGYGTPSPTNLSQALGGDLVFIPGSLGSATRPRHVGMVAGYVDKPDGRHLYIVQAAQTGTPIKLTEATQWAGQVVAVRHIG